jgi:hypothetical protein
MEREGQHFVWYECTECGSVLLWVGDDQWTYQKVGRKHETHLLKKTLTSSELQKMVETATAAAEVSDGEELSADTTRKCPYCAEDIQAAAIVCKHCNRPMPGFEGQVPDLARAESAGVPEAAPHVPKSKRRGRGCLVVFLILLGVAGALAIAGVYLSQSDLLGEVILVLPEPLAQPLLDFVPCSVQAETFIVEVQALVDDWDDANQLASSTSRMALSPVIGQLQQLRREVADLETPECAMKVRNHLLDYMDNTIDGYLAFMTQEDDAAVEGKFESASRQMDSFLSEFVKLRLGSPPYD